MSARFWTWFDAHPGKAGALAGWYQQFASGLITLAMIPLVKHRLSAGNAGLWFSFQNLILIVSLTDFGIGFSVARQVAYSISSKANSASGDFVATQPGWAGVSELYAAVRLIFARVIAVELGLLIILHELVLPLGKLGHDRTLSSTFAWYLLGGSAMALTRAKQYQALLDGLGKMHMSRFFAGTQQFVAGIAAITGLLIRPKLVVMALAVFVISVCYLILIRNFLYREANGRLEKIPRPPPGLSKSLVRIAAPMGMINSSAYLVSAVQVPLIGSLLGPSLVTPFYAAQKIGQMLNTVTMQLVAPQMPLFTRALGAQQFRQTAERMIRIIAIGSIFAVIANFLYFFASPLFARWWLGGRSYVDQTTLFILAVDYTLMCCSVIWAQFVLASGRNPFTKTTLLAGLLNIAGCFVLGHTFGIAGIAASGLAAGLLTNYWFAPVKGVQLLSELQRDSPN